MRKMILLKAQSNAIHPHDFFIENHLWHEKAKE